MSAMMQIKIDFFRHFAFYTVYCGKQTNVLSRLSCKARVKRESVINGIMPIWFY